MKGLKLYVLILTAVLLTMILGGCIGFLAQGKSYDPCAHGGQGLQIGLDNSGNGQMVNCPIHNDGQTP